MNTAGIILSLGEIGRSGCHGGRLLSSSSHSLNELLNHELRSCVFETQLRGVTIVSIWGPINRSQSTSGTKMSAHSPMTTKMLTVLVLTTLARSVLPQVCPGLGYT